MTVPVFTASWRDALRAESQLSPVRISVGVPRWIPRAQADRYRYVPELAPTGGLFHAPPDQFDRLFLAALDQRADRIEEAMAALLIGSTRPVALACFEDLTKPGARCHRTLVAGWLREHLGISVTEWDAPEPEPAQLTMEDR